MRLSDELLAFIRSEDLLVDGVTWVDGHVTTPRGFRASAVEAGIRGKKRLDFALLFSDVPASVAAVFTKNRVKAAPVLLNMERVRSGVARGLLANSGIANACTGEAGLEAAKRLAAEGAAALGVPEEQMLDISTGVIGEQLPVEQMEKKIPELVEKLSPDGGEEFARAVMTTDTRPKMAAVEVRLSGGTVRIGGVAKGAGMIHPNMATMLAFLTTDAQVPARELHDALVEAVDVSLNALTVDGDMSTNDTVFLFANAASGVDAAAEADDWSRFRSGLKAVCVSLARQIAADGEGASKWVTVQVRGAASTEDARKAAREIANSLLVKTAIAGGDANWGRVVASLGASGAGVDLQRLVVRLDGVVFFQNGAPVQVSAEDEARV
ncbi:MAG: bifunctional glutamate N-acetyltransferase/amino-acid acetyltransferase ArgJ, partial [Calditrichaeota bacterium]|nr:bifunctional glutamate N-acetyltransferase/amino-acid acetyltransferase ArgJ [Calditrichota bacterium]